MIIIISLNQQLKQIYMDKKYLTKENINTIFSERVLTVKQTLETKIPVEPAGVLNGPILDRAKRAFIMETVGIYKDEIVHTNHKYPTRDSVEVQFDIDVVVLRKKDYEILKGYYEQLSE